MYICTHAGKANESASLAIVNGFFQFSVNTCQIGCPRCTLNTKKAAFWNTLSPALPFLWQTNVGVATAGWKAGQKRWTYVHSNNNNNKKTEQTCSGKFFFSHILLPRKTLSSSSIFCWLVRAASAAIVFASSTNAGGGFANNATLNADPFKISPDNIQVTYSLLYCWRFLTWKETKKRRI